MNLIVRCRGTFPIICNVLCGKPDKVETSLGRFQFDTRKEMLLFISFFAIGASQYQGEIDAIKEVADPAEETDCGNNWSVESITLYYPEYQRLFDQLASIISEA